MFDQAYPNLRIAGLGCHLVLNNDVKVGSWFLDYPGGEFANVSGNVNILVSGYQMKAMDWIVNPPVISTDKQSPCYKAIQARSNREGEKCLWGPEYLVLIDKKHPAYLYFGNKSSRKLISLIRVGGEYTLISHRRIQDQYVWYVPQIIEISRGAS